MGDKMNSIFLEVDDSALKNKLLLEENLPDDFDQLLPLLESQKAQEEVPWKLAQPEPGLCVKSRLESGGKVFVNICHTQDIPCPQQVDDENLIKLYTSSDDEAIPIRMPLSIGECHEELDKSGRPCQVYDVAVNSGFLQRALGAEGRLQLRFLLQAALQGVRDKFKVPIDEEEYAVLKNRRCMGSLSRHRIEQRRPRAAGPLVEEVGRAKTTTAAAAPAAAPAPTSGPRAPEKQRLLRRPGPDGRPVFHAELLLADVLGAAEVQLRAGEDRLVVESARRGYLWDVFLPLRLDAGAARAHFVRASRVLNVAVPILAS